MERETTAKAFLEYKDPSFSLRQASVSIQNQTVTYSPSPSSTKNIAKLSAFSHTSASTFSQSLLPAHMTQFLFSTQNYNR